MQNPWDILNRKKGRIETPFTKQPKIIITITADPATGEAGVSSNVNLPFVTLISILLHIADATAKNWAEQDQMIVGKSTVGLPGDETEKKGENNDEESKNDNNGRN